MEDKLICKRFDVSSGFRPEVSIIFDELSQTLKLNTTVRLNQKSSSKIVRKWNEEEIQY